MWATVVVVCALLSVAAVIVLKRHGQGLASVPPPLEQPVIDEQSLEVPGTPEQHMVELYKYKRHVPKVPRGMQPSIKKHKYNGEPFGSKKNGPNSGGGNNGLWAQSWADLHENEKNLMRLDDSSLVSRNESVPIGVAHGEGLLHRGVWVAVLRPTPDDQMRCGGSNQMQWQVLRLKRSNSTVTCPGAWGFLGEHGEGVGETWRRMALRAIEEELGLVQVPRPVDLTPGKSMLVKIDYSTAPRYPSKRRDLQATKLFLVTVRHNQVLRVDHEVAALEWQCLSALQKELNDQFHAVSAGWCTAELAALAQLTVKLLVARFPQPKMSPKSERGRIDNQSDESPTIKTRGRGGDSDSRGGRDHDKGGGKGSSDGDGGERSRSRPDMKGGESSGPRHDGGGDVYQPDLDLNRGRDGAATTGKNKPNNHRGRNSQGRKDDEEQRPPVGTSVKRAPGSTVKVAGKWVPGVEPARDRNRDGTDSGKNSHQNQLNQQSRKRLPSQSGPQQEANKQKAAAAADAAARAVEMKVRESAREAEGSAAFRKPKSPRKKMMPPSH